MVTCHTSGWGFDSPPLLERRMSWCTGAKPGRTQHHQMAMQSANDYTRSLCKKNRKNGAYENRVPERNFMARAV